VNKDLDVLYIGNISKDCVICKDGQKRGVWGGSALYSALASRFISDLSIGIFSTIGNDFPNNVFRENNIIFFGKKSKHRSNSFLINENSGSCSLTGKKYLKFGRFKDKVFCKYLHISFREGVSVGGLLDNKNLIFKNLSIDVMSHSVKKNKHLLKKYKDLINFVFCNKVEYYFIENFISNNAVVFITNEDKAVKQVINKETIKTYEVSKVNKSKIKSTTGAGDSFIGGFLASYNNYADIDRSVADAINVSSLSVSCCGNLDLLKMNKAL
jgi:hypothetical protein